VIKLLQYVINSVAFVTVDPFQNIYCQDKTIKLQYENNYSRKKFWETGSRGLYYEKDYGFVMYRLCNKLVFLFVQASVFCPSQNTLAYYEICNVPVNYGFAMFYSTGSRYYIHSSFFESRRIKCFIDF